jgi:serine phosphatase RsbU (regulator of sigma subunit)
MTSTLTISPAAPQGRKPRGRVWRAAGALCRGFGGLALLVGVALKVVCALIRLVAGGAPPIVSGADSAGSLALIVGVVCLVIKVIPRARRRLLWRVRDKLILSYMFIGVVPVLLVISFFVVSGLVLFLNVASYLVTNGFGNVESEAVYLARVTALEIQRGPGIAGASAILDQRETALAARYPGASMAVVPTRISEPCVGGPSAQGAEVSQAGPAAASIGTGAPSTDAGARQGSGIAPLADGPWEHVDPPTSLPPWVSCAGFGGIIVEPAPEAGGAAATSSSAPATAIVRGVGLPDTPHPTFAVIVDIPKNDSLDDHLRDETSVKIGAVSINLTEGLRARLSRPRRAVEGLVKGTSTGAPGAKTRIVWVAILQGTDWDQGQSVQTTANIEVNVGDIYARLSSAQAGPYVIGTVLLIFLLFVAVLFLLIEAAALVMGLTLARSITGSVHELFAGTERVRAGDFSHRIQVTTEDQLGELSASFNQMTGSIEDLLRQADEKKRLEEELRIARSIQMSLLPRGRLVIPGLSITALCVPAREVGGDYYDFFPLGDDRLGVLIADVSGKGTSAALYMAELKGLMLSLCRTYDAPRDLLLAANEIISHSLDSRSFITMTYAVIDLAERRMRYARAGHTPLIHRHETDAGDCLVDVLAPDGLVLGLRIDGGELFARLLVDAELPLRRGDLLLWFTDGMTEAMNADSDLFGEERLAKLVGEHGHLAPEELRERILREIDAFVAGAPQHDDMTMILLKVDDFVAGAVRTGFDDERS